MEASLRPRPITVAKTHGQKCKSFPAMLKVIIEPSSGEKVLKASRFMISILMHMSMSATSEFAGSYAES
jgi:hypothetical protein